jgi:hypothetical protein
MEQTGRHPMHEWMHFSPASRIAIPVRNRLGKTAADGSEKMAAPIPESTLNQERRIRGGQPRPLLAVLGAMSAAI